ncbi:MAG TPA: hypothetical protein VGI10_27615 [Polyangiaceae bacterium]
MVRARFGLFTGLFLIGCSSSPTNSQAGASGPSNAAQVREQVLTACLDFAARVCAGAETCCQQAYGGYDAAACQLSYQTEVCEPAASAVAANVASYDPSVVDGCVAALDKQNALCFPNWAQVIELRKSVYAACKAIQGTALEGQGCSTATTCVQPSGPRTAICSHNLCKVVEILAEGAACSVPNGDVSVCDTGLYCTGTVDGPGVCAPVTQLGSPCQGILENSECGLGNYCDPSELVCKETLNAGGPSCQQSLECLSFQCDRVLETCAPQLATVSHDTCLGSATSM